MKLILIIFCLSLFSLASCRFSRDDRKYVGKWTLNGAHFKKHLKIKLDGTYYYDVFFLQNDKSAGKWKLRNDTLILMQHYYITDEMKIVQGSVFFKKLVYVGYDAKKLKQESLIEMNGNSLGSILIKQGLKKRYRDNQILKVYPKEIY